MRRLGLLHAYGDTAIFDTLMDGLSTINRGRYDKKALLVVTDGMDNASRATLSEVVRPGASDGRADLLDRNWRSERDIESQ